VRIPAKLKKYTGPKLPIEDLRSRLAYERERDIGLLRYHEGSVDWVYKQEQLLLCPETTEFIYNGFTPSTVSYEKGSRPQLEKIVRTVTRGCRTQRAKVLALLKFVRDLPDVQKHGNGPRSACPVVPFHGGTEEEIVKKGCSMCNEQARVLIILSQIAGFPSRYVGHYGCYCGADKTWQGGHGVTEIFMEGKWCYFDIRAKFFQKKDKQLASTWEILQDPGIIDRQPKWILKMMRSRYKMTSTRRWFGGGCTTVVNNYFAADHERYSYPWNWNTPTYRAGQERFMSRRYKQDVRALRSAGE